MTITQLSGFDEGDYVKMEVELSRKDIESFKQGLRSISSALFQYVNHGCRVSEDTNKTYTAVSAIIEEAEK